MTRLTRKIDDFCSQPMCDQQMFGITKLRDDFLKEKIYHAALQSRCEQLLSEKKDVTEDQMTHEMENGEDTDEAYTETLHKAEEAQMVLAYFIESQGLQRDYDSIMGIADSSAEEYEKDCARLQKRLTAYLAQVASCIHSELRSIYDQFVKYEVDVVTKLNQSRGTRKKHREKLATTKIPPAGTPRPSVSSSLRLELPEFTGHPLEWHNFHQLFTSALDRAGEGFSEREKTCFLLKAMKSSEAQQIVRSYSSSEDGYQQALRALILKFGAAKKVFPHLVHKMTGQGTIGFSQEGFSRFRDSFILPLQHMLELGCNTILQFVASLALERFEKTLRDEWTNTYKYIDEVPTLEDICNFLEPLEHNIQSLSLDVRPSTNHSSGSHHSSGRRFTTPSTRPSSTNCQICQEQYRLNRCPVFLGYDSTRRNNVAREKRLCLNCLTSEHKSNECRSSYTCRECHGKHHSFLHQAPNTPSTPAATTTTTNLMAVDTPGTEPSLIEVQSPLQVSFLATVMVTAVNGPRESLARAVLDTGVSSSLITKSLASILKLKRHP